MKSVLAFLLGLAAFTAPAPAAPPIPDALKPWEEWATWNDKHRWCPAPFNDAKKPLCFWPSRLGLQVDKSGGRFDIVVTVFGETWVPLPGSAEAWPQEVTAGGAPIAVVEHDGAPAVKLFGGTQRIGGAYRWSEVPQRIKIPREIGILALVLDGQPVESPVWDGDGFLWLKRDGSTEEADKNFLAVKLYAALEDGIPLWMRTEIELTVSGKSREEDLGTVLPEGWRLASVESALPLAIDDAGRAKAQVRAGKWTLHASAFRFDNPKELRYAAGAKPVAEELLAFRARPDFRTVEITGAPSIDVSQTTFPSQWRDLPVYRWDTTTTLHLEERMRGMGDQKPAGLTIARELWLDEDGRALTFRDYLNGTQQITWRLDAAEGQDLGSVRIGGQGQLITRNPQTSAPGIEIRTRNLALEATGRMPRAQELPATGWRTDAENLRVTLNLPPGWRLFALFGADWVRGDWLTAWTLLDLFLLLIFSLAVGKLWGKGAGALAFVAFGLAYHEPGAPRYLWLVLIVPLALQRVVPAGWGSRIVALGKWLALALFVLVFVPFVAQQVQQALYPQLERIGSSRSFSLQTPDDFGTGGLAAATATSAPAAPPPPAPATPALQPAKKPETRSLGKTLAGVELRTYAGRADSASSDNLNYDAKARIQTGPGVPEWTWREVSFGWNGPVTAAQQVSPILIPSAIERVLTVLRVALLLALASVLLRARQLGGAALRASGKAVVALAFAFTLAAASAQTEPASATHAASGTASGVGGTLGAVAGPIPDQRTLDQLRERLLEVSDAYPHAADIPSAALTIAERKVTLDAEIHAAIRAAVPLPGRLPTWSPVNVLVDDRPEVALRRGDGFLWIVVEPGIHRVHIEGSLAAVTEWEWTFVLKPRQVKIDAPGWNVSGVKPDGTPEAQVFFALKQKAAPGAATYERQEVETIALVERHLELGLLWQVRTIVSRLSPPGKAVALRVPLLPGENVLTSNAIVRDGAIEVRLGAQEQSASWESNLAQVPSLALATRAGDAWVERWRLVISPVWNVTISGLPPVFETGAPQPTTMNATIRASGGDLIPTWQLWPGESVELAISRPEAIAGATMTVSRATHTITLGRRQRISQLDLSLRCSLGEDFLIELPGAAEVTTLAHNGKPIPVRKDGSQLVIPVRPGEQAISIGWKTNAALGVSAKAEGVRLPVESANVETIINVPDDRWVLWAHGPLRGPAVRFWGILAVSLLAAFALGRAPRSPLHIAAWMLLAIGLTQVPLVCALVVAGWLFFLAWRGSENFHRLGNVSYNLWQVVLIVLTASALGILVTAVGEGLLGSPEMFITGNGSTRGTLRWFQARSDALLPRPELFTISIWWYRLAMLAWALWLAAALIHWLRWGWKNFSSGGFFRRKPKADAAPPPLPAKP